jgi:uncharacterized membrane protein
MWNDLTEPVASIAFIFAVIAAAATAAAVGIGDGVICANCGKFGGVTAWNCKQLVNS